MIRGKENLGFEYWSNHNPNKFEITPWERQQLREYFIDELGMKRDHKLDYHSKQLKLLIDFSRRMNYFLSE